MNRIRDSPDSLKKARGADRQGTFRKLSGTDKYSLSTREMPWQVALSQGGWQFMER